MTVEAEHEDEINERERPRKRPKKAAAKPTKVPLKDDIEQREVSPKKRRGRPRKSDAREHGTPDRGSPGRTPKRKASSTNQRGSRPKKSFSSEDATEKMTMGHPAPILYPSQKEPSPFDIAADGGNISESGNAAASLDSLGHQAEASHVHAISTNGTSSRPSWVRDNGNPKSLVKIIEGDSDLTPKPQSTALHVISPMNTLHAGHTPRPRRLYPTPTSSSLIDENLEDGPDRIGRSHEQLDTLGDPTDEHKEFDSIMESEGFSMVSLDSLPSARQGSLGSILNTSNGSLKPFFERQKQGSMDRTKLGTSSRNQEPSARTSASLHPNKSVAAKSGITLSSPNYVKIPLSNNTAPLVKDTSDFSVLHPKVPTPVSASTSKVVLKKKRAYPSLAKVVRAGIALQGILRRQRPESRLRSPFPTPRWLSTREGAEGPDCPGKRLEKLFSGFGWETQRELRAGIRFGEELARRHLEAEKQKTRRRKINVADDIDSAIPPSRVSPQAVTTDQMHAGGIEPNNLELDMGRLQAEWQREREAVSRTIQMASPNQVIVINSDADSGSQRVESNETSFDHQYPDEDDDYEDIWQQEARVHETSPKEPSTAFQLEETSIPAPPYSKSTRPPHRSPDYQVYDHPNNSSPHHRDVNETRVPLRRRSRLRDLREEKVDLSALLNERDTPNTRKYYTNGSPRADISQNSARIPSKPMSINPRHEPSSARQLWSSRSARLAFDDDFDYHISPSVKVVKNPSADLTFEGKGGPTDGDANTAEHPKEEALGDFDESHPPGSSPAENVSTRNSPALESTIQTKREVSVSTSSSWFQRLVRFAPRLWGTTNTNPSWVKYETDNTQEPTPDLTQHQEQIPRQPSDADLVGPPGNRRHEPRRPNLMWPLATSGYFTDDHYFALRHLYRLAKHSPELFPYYPTPRREDMIGDWYWTADGIYGVPVTKIQFGILDVFMQELSEGDRRNGGNGIIGWAEDDLYKRLFSIIVGERIRRERKTRAQEEKTKRDQQNHGQYR